MWITMLTGASAGIVGQSQKAAAQPAAGCSTHLSTTAGCIFATVDQPKNVGFLPTKDQDDPRVVLTRGLRAQLFGRITAYCAHSPRRTSTLTGRARLTLAKAASNCLTSAT